MILRLTLVAISALVAGCLPGPVPGGTTPASFAGSISTSTDSFDGATWFRGPDLSEPPAMTYRLEGYQPAAGPVAFQLRVTSEYFRAVPEVTTDRHSRTTVATPQYRGYFAARDPGGNVFAVEPLTREFHGCSGNFCYFEEVFAVALPAGYLAQRRDAGLLIRVSSREGVYADLAVPPAYVAAMLEKVN